MVHVYTLLFPGQVSDKMDPAELVSLIASLNPDNTPGRLAVIVRMGAEKLRLKFPALIEAVEQAGQVRWQGVGGYCSLISLWRGGCYWRGGCSTGSCQRLGGHEPSQPALGCITGSASMWKISEAWCEAWATICGCSRVVGGGRCC